MDNLEKEFRAYVTLLSVVNEIEQADMVTSAEIQLGITSISRLGDVIKKIQEISEKSQSLEFKEASLSIRMELAKVTEELINATSQITTLKQENQELEKIIKELQKPAYYVGGLYYTTENGQGGTGPYCTGCYDKHKEYIRLTIDTVMTRLICPSCKTTYQQGFHSPLREDNTSYKEATEKEKRKREERRNSRLS